MVYWWQWPCAVTERKTPIVPTQSFSKFSYGIERKRFWVMIFALSRFSCLSRKISLLLSPNTKMNILFQSVSLNITSCSFSVSSNMQKGYFCIRVRSQSARPLLAFPLLRILQFQPHFFSSQTRLISLSSTSYHCSTCISCLTDSCLFYLFLYAFQNWGSEMSGMKLALQKARVRKELNVLLHSDESMLNLFSTVFSNAIIKCYPSQKELVCWLFFQFLCSWACRPCIVNCTQEHQVRKNHLLPFRLISHSCNHETNAQLRSAEIFHSCNHSTRNTTS